MPDDVAIITAIIPNKRTVAIDWIISVKLKNETDQAQWIMLSDSFDEDSLDQEFKASGYTYYKSKGLSKVPVINLYGSPSLEIMFIPAGASVLVENLKIRRNDSKLPEQISIWQASNIIVGNKSIHDSWLRGLNVFTPPRNTKLDIKKRQQVKEMINENYETEKITFEDLYKYELKLELGKVELPEFIQH
jgi:hypothetical protein